MRNLITKQLIYMGFYYFFIIFWLACILFDAVGPGEVSGFTLGYAFALFYFIARARDAPGDFKGFDR